MAQRTIIAYFDSRSEAEAAREALVADGVASSAIALLPDEGTTYTRESTETSYDVQSDRGGFWASLGNLFLPDEDRYAYAEGLSRGGIALSVTTDAAGYDRVADILERSGADNIDEREAEWKSAGWTGYQPVGGAGTAGYDAGTTGMGTTRMGTAGTSTDVSGDETVKVMEERLTVGKREASGGRVRIRSYVREVPAEAQVELSSTRVFVERRPVDRAVGAGDVAFQDRTIEAREHVEQAVVGKETRVVEEIGLRQESESHTETVSDTVRRTEVEIEDERTGETTRVTTDRTSDATSGTTRSDRTGR